MAFVNLIVYLFSCFKLLCFFRHLNIFSPTSHCTDTRRRKGKKEWMVPKAKVSSYKTSMWIFLIYFTPLFSQEIFIDEILSKDINFSSGSVMDEKVALICEVSSVISPLCKLLLYTHMYDSETERTHRI